MKNILAILFLSLSLPFCYSQNVLSLEQAKMLTLENNFGIRISQNNVQLAENLTDRKANGYRPTVSASGALNATYGSASQNFSTGLDASTDLALGWTGGASVQADYTIYDKSRELTLDQLKESLALSNLQLEQAIQQNLLGVYQAYYELAIAIANVEVLEETIGVSSERLRRAEYQLEYGQGNGLDVLNAEVDIKRDSVNLLNARLNVENTRRNLNITMGTDPREIYTIEAITDIAENLNLETLLAEAKQKNIDLQINRQNQSVSELDLNIIDAEKKPTLSANASYDYNYANNAPGSFVVNSQSQGLTGRLTLAWNLYDASRDIRKQNTVLNLTNLRLETERIEQQLERDIINAWANYENAKFVLQVERSAVSTNEENFYRTEEQLKFGRLTSIEFRQAQLNLLNAQTSVNNAVLNLKVAEIQLLALVGELL
jgi:outer membrane protein TolC